MYFISNNSLEAQDWREPQDVIKFIIALLQQEQLYQCHFWQIFHQFVLKDFKRWRCHQFSRQFVPVFHSPTN